MPRRSLHWSRRCSRTRRLCISTPRAAWITTAARLKTTLTPVYVTGHAGSERGVQAVLSLKRARTVAQCLSAQGVRVWTRFDGIGDQHAKGRPSDRRVEIRAI